MRAALGRQVNQPGPCDAESFHSTGTCKVKMYHWPTATVFTRTTQQFGVKIQIKRCGACSLGTRPVKYSAEEQRTLKVIQHPPVPLDIAPAAAASRKPNALLPPLPPPWSSPRTPLLPPMALWCLALPSGHLSTYAQYWHFQASQSGTPRG
jgi:hypothetical protein